MEVVVLVLLLLLCDVMLNSIQKPVVVCECRDGWRW